MKSINRNPQEDIENLQIDKIVENIEIKVAQKDARNPIEILEEAILEWYPHLGNDEEATSIRTAVYAKLVEKGLLVENQ